MERRSGKIRRILVDEGPVAPEAWAEALETGMSPVGVLLSRGEIDENTLLETLGRAAGMAPLDVRRIVPDPETMEVLSPEVCLRYGILPIARNGENLTIAIPDPFDVLLIDDLALLSGCRVRPVLSSPVAIQSVLESFLDDGKRQVDEFLEQVSAGEGVDLGDERGEELDLVSGSGEEVPAVKLVNLILLRALREKASDIHVEPGVRSVRVRIRVDGSLSEILRPPRALLPSLISRLKILGDLDIAERMGPQDGKFQIRHEGRSIDFRLSTLPVVGGEKAVLRILDPAQVSGRLDALGFEPRCLDDIQRAITSAHGMVLLTGPTGSGKSTTLYAAVRRVARPEINVVTVEDPVEYEMDGVNQVPVNPRRGLTFAGALRSILRQDPDVVLVGEVRDSETAEIAVKAALTGHLVLSTLHTNDAVGAITRLADMGVDPFMVASSLVCVCAQRLVRQLCPHCRKPVEVPDDRLIDIGFHAEELEGLTLFEPAIEGCPRCKNGYRGRFAVLETLPVDAEIRRMIVAGRSAQEIKAEGIRCGMLTLRRVGLKNAARGRTSLAEILRVTVED